MTAPTSHGATYSISCEQWLTGVEKAEKEREKRQSASREAEEEAESDDRARDLCRGPANPRTPATGLLRDATKRGGKVSFRDIIVWNARPMCRSRAACHLAARADAR